MQENHFTELVDAGVQGEVHKVLNQKPWMEDHARLEDLMKANRYLTYTFARRHRSGRSDELNDRQQFFPSRDGTKVPMFIITPIRSSGERRRMRRLPYVMAITKFSISV